MYITKEKNIKDNSLSSALGILPPPMRAEIMCAVNASGVSAEEITDIRLRRGGASFFTANGRSYPLGGDISPREFDDIVFYLTGGSLYAHAETIREGYISAGGIRCGVCGRAVMKDGNIGEVTDITSVTLRVAHDIPGCACRVFNRITRGGAVSGALIYSPPGGGKTTLLRDLIFHLSEAGRQFAVIDSRRELGGACEGGCADIMTDYPKYDGIMCAVRSLSPELIICDELSGERDADAALYAFSCGVPIVATAHSGSEDELRSRHDMRALLDAGVFPHIFGLDRRHHIITSQ